MTKLNTTNDSDIYLWNAETRALTHLTPHKGEAQYSPATFDPPSRYLYYLVERGGRIHAPAPVFAGRGHARGRREG